MSPEECEEAACLFRKRVAATWRGVTPMLQKSSIQIQDVDMVMRQLRVCVPMRFIWALFLEIDEDGNGMVDQDEFLRMVALLRGRLTPSNKFYLRTLAREKKDQYRRIFEYMDQDQDGVVDEEIFVSSFRTMNPSISTDSEEFKKLLGLLDGAATKRYAFSDFCVIMSRVRRPTACPEAAAMCFSEQEADSYETVFLNWRATKHGHHANSPHELRSLLQHMGLQCTLDRVRRLLEELEIDRHVPITTNQFLYLMFMLGSGTQIRPRRMLTPGASYEEAYKTGIRLEELWELGYDNIRELRRAGWSVKQMQQANVGTVDDYKQAGFQAADLRKLGLGVGDLSSAGFALADLRNAGFGTEMIRACAIQRASTPARLIREE